jgi:hypothetical protein
MAFLLGAKDDLYREAFSLSGVEGRISGSTIAGGSCRDREGGVTEVGGEEGTSGSVPSCRSRNDRAAKASAAESSRWDIFPGCMFLSLRMLR